MAIIKCPECKQKISSKAKVCSHCHYRLSGSSDEVNSPQQSLDANPMESAEDARMARIKQRHSLQMQMMGGLIVFLGGILLWYFVGQHGFKRPSQFVELGIAALGGVWYLVTRIRIIALKYSD